MDAANADVLLPYGSDDPLGLDQAFITGAAEPPAGKSIPAHDPWQNERMLWDGRSAANPEYLVGNPIRLDEHGILATGLSSSGETSPGLLWDDEVAGLEKELARKLDQAEEEKEKLELLKSKKLRRKCYVETLQLQFRSLQNLKNARQDEVDSLQKQVDLCRLETAHLNFEKTRAHQHAEQLVARCGRAENVMNRLKMEITNLQTETDLDRELMGACLTYSEKHEAEFRMLDKYCCEDEEKLKDCLYRIDHLTVEEEKSRKEEGAMELLKKGTRVEFERIQQQVREGNADRDAHIEHWAKIKKQAHSGEKYIQRLHDELDSLAAKRAAKLEALERQREFYESELRNNNQLERRLEGTEFNVIKARDVVTDMEKKKREMLNQIYAFENACAAKRRTIKSLKANIKDLSKQIHNVRDDATRWRNLAYSVEAKNSQVNQKNLTDEERLVELNKTLDEREALVFAAEQRVIKLRDTNYKKTQQNTDLRAKLDTATVTVRGSSLYLNNLCGQMKQNRVAEHNQAQQIYELEYKVTQLERRIAFMEGTDTGPSEKSLEEVKHLTKRKNHILDEINLMKGRIYKQEEWIKNLKKEVDARDTEQKKNEIALAEIMLYLHTTERSVDKVKMRRIESAVEVSSSRLKLRYIADKADTKLDTVTGMSIRHVELSGLFKERMATVALEREKYRAQRNRVEEQRSWFVKILRELEHQQRGVKTRFELLTLPIMGMDQGQGDAMNIVQIQASFFVKVAHEKQNIINHRTQLKEDIQKVMQDNYRLRQFLQNYKAQTHEMKNNVFYVKQKSAFDQRGLDEEISLLRERLRAHEAYVFGYKEELQLLQRTTDKLELLQDKVQQGMRQENAELKTLLAEVNEQKMRLDRTVKQNGVMLAMIKKTLPAEDWSLVKVDIEIGLYTDSERLLYSTISRFLDAYPEAFTLVEHFFKEMAIEMSEELTKTLLRSASGSKHAFSSPTTSSTKLFS